MILMWFRRMGRAVLDLIADYSFYFRPKRRRQQAFIHQLLADSNSLPEKRLIVSLSTMPDRINRLQPTLNSLLNQTRPVTRRRHSWPTSRSSGIGCCWSEQPVRRASPASAAPTFFEIFRRFCLSVLSTSSLSSCAPEGLTGKRPACVDSAPRTDGRSMGGPLYWAVRVPVGVDLAALFYDLARPGG